MSSSVPFVIEYDVGSDELTMSGDLIDTPEIREQIEKEVTKGGGPYEQMLVNADMCRIFLGGEMAWVHVVQKYLEKTKLYYQQSQLAILVKYKEDYTHPHTHYFGTY